MPPPGVWSAEFDREHVVESTALWNGSVTHAHDCRRAEACSQFLEALVADVFVNGHDGGVETPGREQEREKSCAVAGDRYDQVTVADSSRRQGCRVDLPIVLQVVRVERSGERGQVNQRARRLITPQAIELLDDGVHKSESIP